MLDDEQIQPIATAAPHVLPAAAAQTGKERARIPGWLPPQHCSEPCLRLQRFISLKHNY